jgi:hypothetical protein
MIEAEYYGHFCRLDFQFSFICAVELAIVVAFPGNIVFPDNTLDGMRQ